MAHGRDLLDQRKKLSGIGELDSNRRSRDNDEQDQERLRSKCYESIKIKARIDDGLLLATEKDDELAIVPAGGVGKIMWSLPRLGRLNSYLICNQPIESNFV